MGIDYQADFESSESEDESEESDGKEVEPELQVKTEAPRQRIRVISNTANLMIPSTTPTFADTYSS
jgi:hypothetical protein